MSFFSPINFLFLLGIIPIIIMYLLKKKHQDVEVSSIYLWEKAVRDVEANAPWQRLRKNILLILQLLIFIMLVFFLTKPYIISDTFKTDNLIIVIDKSLSMSTLEDNVSRLDKSKKDVENILKNLKPKSSVTLITMDDSPEVIISKSKYKSVLLDKFKKIQQSNSTDNVEETLSLLKAMTNEMENYKVIFYTDKSIETDIDNLIIKKIGNPHNNLAIENLSCKKDNNSVEALIDVKNYGNRDQTTDLIIYKGNEIYDVKEIFIKAGESKKIYAEGIPKTDIIKAEIDIDDPLKADNERYCVIEDGSARKVLMITRGNIFLEKAIALNENIELYKTNEVLPDIEGYDLYVYDEMLPASLPTDGSIFILNPANFDGVVKVNEIVKEGKLTVSEEDELLKYVDFDISMSRVKLLSPPDWGRPFIYSNDEAIGFKGIKKNQKFVVLGFDIHDTDLPLKYSFPIFIQNVLDYTLDLNLQRNTKVFSGQGIEINISPKTREAYVTGPNKDKIRIAPPFPVSTFTDTNDTGVYTVEQNIDDIKLFSYFASNVNTIKESNISYDAETLNQVDIKDKVEENAMVSVKNVFLIIALIILAAEWVVYSRGY